MSADLKAAFPDMKGWSTRNLKYMRAFADTWRRSEIVQAPLGQLPWYHHLTLLERLKSRGDRMVYAALAVENGWSRNDIVAEYALADLDKLIGVSTYQLGLPSPAELQTRLQKVLAAPCKTRRRGT